METDRYKARAYVPADAPLVHLWAVGHGKERLPVEFLPPDGVIVERDGSPVCAAWLYKSYGVGVAFMEHVHTASGLTMTEAREAIAFATEFLRFSAREDGYGVIYAYTVPAMAKQAQRDGWQIVASDRVCIATETGLAEMERRAA